MEGRWSVKFAPWVGAPLLRQLVGNLPDEAVPCGSSERVGGHQENGRVQNMAIVLQNIRFSGVGIRVDGVSH